MLREDIPNSKAETPIFRLIGILGVLVMMCAIAIPTSSSIANMHGSDFLVLYGCVITITFFVSARLVQPTKNQALPLIPTAPDPYEIAYLHSEARGVVKVAVIDLIQQSYLEITENSIKQAKNHPDLSNLTPIQREAFDWFSTPRTPITTVSLLTEHIQPHCTVYQQQLQNEQLLNSEQIKAKKWQIALIGTLIIVGLGSFKLIVALIHGRHNVGYLILMGILSLYFLWSICKVAQRRTCLGEAYLKQLKETFFQLKQRVKTVVASEVDYNLVVALFGFDALAGTHYDYFQKILSPVITTRTSSTSDSGGGCGGGCSSGSSCGGGCGGGCGGCGGCGG
jgi:uncharacterized protein (TIGR04222 family)